jgi:VanZ family protein
MISRRLFKFWLPVIVWLAIMFVGSTDLMSAEQTSRIIGPLLRWLKPDLSAEAIAHIQFFVRKGAHVTEYALLAALFWRAVRYGTDLRMKMSILSGAVLLACAALAASDEFHQSFVGSRTSSTGDVMIDVCGAMIGLAICLGFARRKNSVQTTN